MTFHERLLRLTLGARKAVAILGDLEEDAARLGKSARWIRRQALGCVCSAAWLSAMTKGTRMLTTIRLAFRDARRALLRFPGTSLASILILSISMAAGAITFAVVDTVVLRPLPYDEPDRLVTIFTRGPKIARGAVAVADYDAWRAGTGSFHSIAAWRPWPFDLTDESGSERVTMVVTTASLFEVLRARPLLGATFGPEHEFPGRDGVAVISHGLWLRRFGGTPDAIGKTLRTPTGPVTIIGVMPQGFGFPVEAAAPAAIWRPFAPKPEERVITAESGRASYLTVIARLEDGVSLAQAQADVERVFAGMGSQFPVLYANLTPGTERLLDALTDRVARWMRLVLGAVAVLIAIGCVNVSNLLLTRSARQVRDMAVRLSLGARRGQVVASLVAESLLLAGIATALGLVTAGWLLPIVKTALPADIVRAASIQFDARVFSAAALCGFVTALIAGLAPGWHASRLAPAQALKNGAGTAGGGRRAWQHTLLVTQVALVTTLVVASTLLVGSFVRVVRTDLGFARQELIGVSVSAPAAIRKDAAAMTAFFQRTSDAIRSVPGVSHVAAQTGGQLPLYSGYTMTRLTLPGDSSPGLQADLRRVSPGYFEAAGIHLREGRDFSSADPQNDVVVIDDLAGRQLFDGRSPVGQTITVGGLQKATIIGVTSNVRLQGPEGELQPQIYRPLHPERDTSRLMLIRLTMDPQSVIPSVRAALNPIVGSRSATMKIDVVEEQFRVVTADRRFSAGVMAALGVLALLIGVSGIYATTASIVAQQTKEIGIRMALGASLRRVVATAAGAAARLLLAGVVIGLVAAWVAAGILQSVVFGIQPTDLVVYAVPFAVVVVLGTLAALIPARRAARVDPLVALRAE